VTFLNSFYKVSILSLFCVVTDISIQFSINLMTGQRFPQLLEPVNLPAFAQGLSLPLCNASTLSQSLYNSPCPSLPVCTGFKAEVRAELEPVSLRMCTADLMRMTSQIPENRSQLYHPMRTSYPACPFKILLCVTSPKVIIFLRQRDFQKCLFPENFLEKMHFSAGCPWLTPVILANLQRSGGSRFKATLGQ
jgi:hypothetical protein